MKLVLSILALGVSLSMTAEPIAIGDIAGGTTWQGSDVETVYWTQLPTGNFHSSQYFNDMWPTWDSGVADDFEFAVSTTINRIRWWGGYAGGTAPVVPNDSPVEIYLYLDDGTGNAPSLPQHVTALAAWMIPASGYTEVADGANYRCEFDFPTWLVFPAGQKYWFEIRKAFPFDPLGQYGLIGSIPVTLSTGVQGMDGSGIPWWTPMDESGIPNDAAFELVFDDAIALERTTWGEIKTIF